MRLRRILCAAMLPLVSLFWSLSSSAAAGATLDSAEQDLVTRINDFRAGRGLPTVTVSDPLTAAAKWMSADMSVHNYFAHTSLDGARPDLAYNWLSMSRAATTTTSYVGPGQVGWFEFSVRAPQTPGDYRLSVRGVVDGVTWLEDSGIFFTIHVR